MSLITGPITSDGAVVIVSVGVSDNRRKALERVGFPVPHPFPSKHNWIPDHGQPDSVRRCFSPWT